MLEPQDLDPAQVLRPITALGGAWPRTTMMACEPLTFGGDNGAMGLSEPVTAAVDTAITTVEDLVDELFKGEVLS